MVSKHKWKNQYKRIDSASNFHNELRQIFIEDSMFARFSCYQEINVQDLIEDYPYHNHHFDWYIEEMNLIIELHGQQHYKAVNFGDMSYREAERNFYKIRDRDNTKKTAAINAGYEYVEISYKYQNKLTPETFKQLIYKELT